MRNPITIHSSIAAPLNKVWDSWTNPEHITNWNHANNDWHCPRATNDLRVGGNFCYTMAAKDGSMEFDFKGTFTELVDEKFIAITLEDQRKMEVHLTEENGEIKVAESFEAENENPRDMQEMGWQMILDNFKTYVESSC